MAHLTLVRANVTESPDGRPGLDAPQGRNTSYGRTRRRGLEPWDSVGGQQQDPVARIIDHDA
jgi:hypothetical protein